MTHFWWLSSTPSLSQLTLPIIPARSEPIELRLEVKFEVKPELRTRLELLEVRLEDVELRRGRVWEDVPSLS